MSRLHDMRVTVHGIRSMDRSQTEWRFKVEPPHKVDGVPYYTVYGVAPDGQPSHYDIQDALRREFPNVDFDSEQGEFFAYAYGPIPAKRLCNVLNERYGREV